MNHIVERFLETASRLPGRAFLVSSAAASTEELSYAETLRMASVFREHLTAAGIGPGERVVLNCPNSLHYVCAYFGIWLAGGTAVPLDPRSRPENIDRIVSDCAARCVIVPARREDLDPHTRQFALSEVDWGASSGVEGRSTPDNPLALIIYTSGTTGAPRGVCLTHDSLEHTRASITSWAGVTERDRELLTLPLTHLFGLAHLHVYSALGATIHIEDGFRDVPRLLDIIQNSSITSFPTTPGSFKVILDRFADSFAVKARRLRYMIINTAPMPIPMTEKLLSALPDTEVFMYYGLTEASRSTYIAYRSHLDKLGTVGRATPGAQVCIGAPQQQRIGEPGEILVRGPHVMQGYWGQDSREFFDQGWLRTGDLGTIDKDGFVTWLGRVREQINVNGLKLVPAEVEDVLRLDPKVLDCAVVGVPDAATGEGVVAFVVADGGTPDSQFERHLRKLCNDCLDAHKVPRRVLFVSEIPKTTSGKIKRFLLRDRWIDSQSTREVPTPGATRR